MTSYSLRPAGDSFVVAGRSCEYKGTLLIQFDTRGVVTAYSSYGCSGLENDYWLKSTGDDTLGLLDWRHTWRYDEKGRLVSAQETEMLNGEGHLTCEINQEFDAVHGKITSRTLNHWGGALEEIWKYSYDAEGNLLSDTLWSNQQEQPQIHLYGQQGQMVLEKSGDGYQHHFFYKDNKLIAESRYTGGIRLDTTTYKYDAQGRQVEMVEVKAGEAGFMKTVTTYDGQGRLLEQSLFSVISQDGHPLLERRDGIRYDERGNVIETFNSFRDEEARCVILYDEHDHPIEVALYGNSGELENIKRYNAQGLILSQEVYYAGKKEFVFRSDYTLDKQGNWIKMVTWQNGKPRTLSFRNISYY